MRFAAVLLVVALAGCSAIQGRDAADAEDLLAQAGFQRQPLHDANMPARQLVRAGDRYHFSDPERCRCVFVGGAKEYAELQRLRAERIAERDWALRHSGYGSTWSPAVWSAWNPQGLDVVESAGVGR